MRVLTSLLLLLLPACAAWNDFIAPKYKGPAWSKTYIDPQNRDCDLYKFSDEYQQDYSGHFAKTPQGWVRMVMCEYPDPRTNAPDLSTELHPLVASGIVSACVAITRCEPTAADVRWNWVAHAWDLAMRTEPEAVEAALATTTLPDYMKRDFVIRYRAARDRIFEVVKAQGKEWRELFLKPALNARADRAAADEVLAPWLEQVTAFVEEADAAVLAGAVVRKLFERGVSLRREYVDACREVRRDLRVCLADNASVPLTTVLHRLAVELDDDAFLAAEESALRNLPLRTDPRTDERIAAQAAVDATRARHAEYAKAKEMGLSEAVIAKKWPVPPFDVKDWDAVIGVNIPAESFSFHRHDDVMEVYDDVRVIKKSGKKATIHFRKNVYTGYEPTGCYETNKVEGFNDDGTVRYRWNCTGPDRKYTDDRTTEPVTVPAAEAAKVKPGELVHVYVDTKTRVGHIGWVGKGRDKDDRYTRDTEKLQLREWRLP